MSKTDKELTAEIVTSYISSWNSSENVLPMKATELIDLLQAVHSTLKTLND